MWKDDNHRQAGSSPSPSTSSSSTASVTVTVSSFSLGTTEGGRERGCGFCAPDVVVRLIRFGSLPVHKIYV